MARWSNDLYKSTPHRVSSPKRKTKILISIFIQPSQNCNPFAYLTVTANQSTKYLPITSMEYLQSRFGAT
jgi:isopenicillin N synthase-like dioxygenase